MSRNFLDVDDSLLARNLFIGNNAASQDVSTLDAEVSFPGARSSSGPQILTPSERREQSQCKFIIPHPGICIKCNELTSGQKVFINLCTSDDVPEPDEYLTDEQLATTLSEGSNEDVCAIRMPMSIGEKHIEKDKGGNPCPVFDIVINKRLFEKKIVVSEMYRTFMVIITIEAIEEKFKFELDKDDYVVLNHKKCMGKLNPHFVKSKPVIKEVKTFDCIGGSGNTLSSTSSTTTLVEEIDCKETQLDCVVTQITNEYAKAEIKIPKLRNSKKLSVTLGADRIIVDSPVGSLDIIVPIDIHQEKSKAEFDVDTNILTLHLPLAIKP